MGTIKLTAGVSPGLTWTDIGAVSNANSMPSADAVIVSTQIDNSSNLDVFADVSFSLGSVTPGAGSPYIGLALLELNQDGTSYSNGVITTSQTANGLPSECYVGSISCVPSTAGVITGMVKRIKLPAGKFVFSIYDGAGVTLASSANVIKYRTYSLQD